MVEACHYGSLTDDQAIHFIKTVQGVPYNMVRKWLWCGCGCGVVSVVVVLVWLWLW